MNRFGAARGYRQVLVPVVYWVGSFSLSPRLLAGLPFPDYDWTYSFGTSWDDSSFLGDALFSFSVAPDGTLVMVGGFGFEMDTPILSADFDPTLDEDRRTSAGLHDVVLVRMSPRGDYLGALTFGGPGDDLAWGVVTLADGSTLVSGRFQEEVDFDPGPGEFVATAAGAHDVFLTKLGPHWEHLWTKTFGAADYDAAYGLSLHPGGGVMVFGEFAGTVDFDPGVGIVNRTATRDRNAFLVRLTDDGAFVSVITLEGNGFESAYGAAADEQGAVFLAGYFSGTPDFDPGPGVASRTAVGGQDAFLTCFNPDGNLRWVWTIGSPGQDVATDVKLSPEGAPIVVGLFGTTAGSIDFDPTDGIDLHRTTRSQEAYVTKLGADGSYHWTRTTLTSSFAYANTLAVSRNGIVVTGAGRGNINFSAFEPTPEVLTLRVQEAYAWALSPEGGFEWAFSVPNADISTGQSVPIAADFDPFGNLLFAGFFTGAPDFDPGSDAGDVTSLGGHDAFFAKFRAFHPSGDHNRDGRVDLLDIAQFFPCFGGQSPDTPCESLDLDENLRIDALDFQEFQRDLTGP